MAWHGIRLDYKEETNTGYSPIFLLTCSVKDVQKASLAINNNLLPIRILDRGVIFIHEMVLN